jgi:predicted transcriptional regulator
LLVILSIKPKYAEALLSGKKTCEFRKNSFSNGIKTVIIYESAPVSKIVGWFTIKKQFIGKPSYIWRMHSKKGGISKKEFDDYYNGSTTAVCLEIDKIKRIKPPIDPFELSEEFIAPQSYRYANDKDLSFLIPNIPEFNNQRLLTDHYDKKA